MRLFEGFWRRGGIEELLTAPFGSIRFDAYEHAAEEVAYFLEIGIEDALGTVRVLISILSLGGDVGIIIPVRNSSDHEDHNALIRSLLRNATVRIWYLSGVFAHSGAFHERVLDVAFADECSVEDLADEECKSG